MRGLALGFDETHKFSVGPVLELVTQLPVICKILAAALDPIIYVIKAVIKQYWS